MARPLFIHLDMSLSGDKTGIAGVWITGKRPQQAGNNDPSKELEFKVAFSVSVKAPKGFQVSFEKNEEGQYHYEGDTEEFEIGKPDTMIVNGDSGQCILYDHFKDETHVWGYKYSSVNITVNGIVPQIKTYTFAGNGKEWSVDRWWLDIADENVEIYIQATASSKEE